MAFWDVLLSRWIDEVGFRDARLLPKLEFSNLDAIELVSARVTKHIYWHGAGFRRGTWKSIF